MLADCLDAALVAKVILLRLLRAEFYQISIILQPVEYHVIRRGHRVPHRGLPDTAQDAALSAAAVGVLEALFGQRQEVHVRIDIGHPVEYHRRLVGIFRVRSHHIGLHKRPQHPPYVRPVNPRIVVRNDAVLLPLLIEHPVPVIHVELVQRVFGVRMVGIDEQLLVTEFPVEKAVLIQRALIERPEIVFRIHLAAGRALELPCARRLPRVVAVLEDSVGAFGAAVFLVRVDVARQILRGYHLPQLVIAELHVAFGARNRALLGIGGPGMLLDIRQRIGAHLSSYHAAALLGGCPSQQTQHQYPRHYAHNQLLRHGCLPSRQF